jgi:hypothetical protein
MIAAICSKALNTVKKTLEEGTFIAKHIQKKARLVRKSIWNVLKNALLMK